MTLTTTAEDLAIETLEFLASRVGIATVNAALQIVTGGSAGILGEDLSILVGGVCSCVVIAIGEDRAKAAIAKLFAAADLAVDAAEDAKFPQR